MNGPLVGAPEVPMGEFCIEFCPGSNGSTPGPQNPQKQIKNAKCGLNYTVNSILSISDYPESAGPPGAARL